MEDDDADDMTKPGYFERRKEKQRTSETGRDAQHWYLRWIDHIGGDTRGLASQHQRETYSPHETVKLLFENFASNFGFDVSFDAPCLSFLSPEDRAIVRQGWIDYIAEGFYGLQRLDSKELNERGWGTLRDNPLQTWASVYRSCIEEMNLYPNIATVTFDDLAQAINRRHGTTYSAESFQAHTHYTAVWVHLDAYQADPDASIDNRLYAYGKVFHGLQEHMELLRALDDGAASIVDIPHASAKLRPVEAPSSGTQIATAVSPKSQRPPRQGMTPLDGGHATVRELIDAHDNFRISLQRDALNALARRVQDDIPRLRERAHKPPAEKPQALHELLGNGFDRRCDRLTELFKDIYVFFGDADPRMEHARKAILAAPFVMGRIVDEVAQYCRSPNDEHADMMRALFPKETFSTAEEIKSFASQYAVIGTVQPATGVRGR